MPTRQPLSRALWDSVANSTTYISVQYTDAQNTVLCLLAEKMGEKSCLLKQKRAQILGSKHSILAKSILWEHRERKLLYRPSGFHVESRWGFKKGWDNSNAHRNDLQYNILWTSANKRPKKPKRNSQKNAVHEFTKCKTSQPPLGIDAHLWHLNIALPLKWNEKSPVGLIHISVISKGRTLSQPSFLFAKWNEVLPTT